MAKCVFQLSSVSDFDAVVGEIGSVIDKARNAPQRLVDRREKRLNLSVLGKAGFEASALHAHCPYGRHGRFCVRL